MVKFSEEYIPKWNQRFAAELSMLNINIFQVAVSNL